MSIIRLSDYYFHYFAEYRLVNWIVRASRASVNAQTRFREKSSFRVRRRWFPRSSGNGRESRATKGRRYSLRRNLNVGLRVSVSQQLVARSYTFINQCLRSVAHNALVTDCRTLWLLLSDADARGSGAQPAGTVLPDSGATNWLSGDYSGRKNHQLLQEARVCLESR